MIVSTKALDDPLSYAEVDHVSKELVLNPKNETLDEFVCTIVHEILHIMSPETPEPTVTRLENGLEELLTPSDRTTIFRAAAACVEWEEGAS